MKGKKYTVRRFYKKKQKTLTVCDFSGKMKLATTVFVVAF